MTPSGIEPATFRFVAQHLGHCALAPIPSPSGFGTRNPSRRAAADLRLRLRGYWDRQLYIIIRINNSEAINNNYERLQFPIFLPKVPI